MYLAGSVPSPQKLTNRSGGPPEERLGESFLLLSFDYVGCAFMPLVVCICA